MLAVTKIFHFEMAHAIYGYSGDCKNIHGHSYKLHVTVAGKHAIDSFLSSTGFIIDFKLLKQLVNENIVSRLDHKLVLSKAFITAHPLTEKLENLLILDMEPSAENLIIYIQTLISSKLPEHIQLLELTLYETADSYVRWSPDDGK